jgi:surfactin synthase thioesterase subunit
MTTQPVNEPSASVKIFNPAPGSDVRLVCFPQLGASASAFTALSAALPASVETLSIQYPGRQGAHPEAGIRNIGDLAGDICAELLSWADRPLAVFGHSMGAAVGFEVTRRLEAAGVRPVRLFVSGRPAPSLPVSKRHLKSDEDFVAELKMLGGVPERLLDRPKYRKAILTVVRNDYQANRSYQCPPETTIACAITFLFAAADPYVEHDSALAWKTHTSGEFRISHFSGDHSFINEQLPKVAEEILKDLSR